MHTPYDEVLLLQMAVAYHKRYGVGSVGVIQTVDKKNVKNNCAAGSGASTSTK